MNESILITGIGGSGKSVISKELRKLGYKAYNMEEIKGLFKMINKKTGKPAKDYSNYDLKSVKENRWTCNKKKLQKLLKKNPKGIVFYCGTASNLDDLLPLFDKVFLLKLKRKILSERLSNRTSNDFGRTSEVQKWIFSWKNWWERHMKEKGAIVINANQDIKKVIKEIIQKV